MGLGDVDYGDFIPIDILARGVPMLVARTDAPFDTVQEMIDYVQANPGEVKIGSTGPGGLPSVITAMVSEQEQLGSFFANMLSSPLSLVLFAAAVLTLLSQTPVFSWIRRGKRGA
jgi:hypothetical protein